MSTWASAAAKARKVKKLFRWRPISLLVVLGVREDGQKVLLAIKSMGGESSEAWRTVLDDLINRGLQQPEFLIVDGAQGLDKAIAGVWDGVPVQRCTVHKHRNLLAHAPERLLGADANIIVGAAFDQSLDGIIRVSVVATGVDINAPNNPSRRVWRDHRNSAVHNQRLPYHHKMANETSECRPRHHLTRPGGNVTGVAAVGPGFCLGHLRPSSPLLKQRELL
jgi:hypothetical protein